MFDQLSKWCWKFVAIVKLRREAKRSLRELRRRESALRSLSERIDQQAAQAMQAAANAQAAIMRYEEALAEAQAKLRVCEDVTIPMLTAANTLALERYTADIALQVRRQVGPLPTSRFE